MLELSTVVEARDANHQPEILPLFFMIPPEALKQIKTLNEKWKETGIDDRRRVKWPQALKAIGRINGLKFSEGGNEVEFRDEIVKEIWSKLPTASPRYHVPFMQGELRMCQEVEDFFKKKVPPNKKGISIAGLYGIPGQGKTTLGKAFCNFKLKDFEGKVCHLEFCKGDSFERTKLALRYIAQCPPSHLQDLTKDQAQVDLHKRMKGQRVLLVLDDITEESKDEVRDFVQADFRENSCILLCARSVDVLVKHYRVRQQSCLCVPSLEEDDAIAILLEGTSLEESKLGPKGKAFALKCAKRGSLKELSPDTIRRGRTYHPLALKAFGSHLFGKYSSNLSKWAAEINGLVDPSSYGLDGVFALLDKAFDDMEPKYRTIFMLLTIYIPPNMSAHNVIEWLAICCNEEIEVIEKAVEDLCKKAFIEEFVPEIRIHDLCFEFAQCKAKGMGRWLWWKGDGRSTRGLISQDNAGFELAKLERCMYRIPSQIDPKFLKNLLVLQLVGMQNMRKLDLGGMDNLRSITLHDCKVLAELDGMENMLNLAWLQIRGVDQMLKLPKLSRLLGLQHLEIDIAVSQAVNRLGDLTSCFCLREITVRCPSLLEFPMLNGLPYLEKVEFSMCDKVKAPLDCRECVELQSIVLAGCCQMAASPLLSGCEKLSKIILSECDAVTACPVMDVPSALRTLVLQISSITASASKSLESCCRLENLQLWNMGKLEKLPSFRSLSYLTVLKIGKCGITDLPDLTCCEMLEDIDFFALKHLARFPNFTLLRKLKKLSLYNCSRVRDPPDISGCHQLQLFYLLYNDNMKGLSKMDKCAQLEEIKVSWHCEDEVKYEGFDPDSCQADDDLETCLDCFKDVFVENLNDISVPVELEQWTQGKSMLVMKYIRGLKLHYVVTVPYESNKSSKCYCKSPITLTLVQSKVLVFSTLDRANGDYVWLNRVRQYFAGQEISCASASSGQKVHTSSRQPSPRYRFRMWKTTLTKAFSAFDLVNFNLWHFDRKVHHPELWGGDALGRQTLALQYLIQFRNLQSEWARRENRALYFFNTTVEGQKVLLVMDNISENNINEMRCYVGEELGENSRILLSARSADVLKTWNIQSFKSLQEEMAIVISIDVLTNGADVLSKWAAKIDGLTDEDSEHPLKDGFDDRLGDHLDEVFDVLDTAFQDFSSFTSFSTYLYCLGKWFSEIDFVDDVFAGLCWLAIKCRVAKKSWSFPTGIKGIWSSTYKDVEGTAIKFKKEIKYIQAKMSSDRVVKWIAINCKKAIKEKVEEMKHNFCIKELLQIIKENYNEMACKIVEAISLLLPLSPRYHVPSMQGETRMCQKVVDFFNTDVHPNDKGISITGLYGMPGLGKTTLAKALCNVNLLYFSGKVCVLQFCGGNELDRGKHALRYLTQFPTCKLESITSKDNARYIFNTLVKGQRVLLVMDNITEDSIDEVRHYLGAELGRKSCIILIARSVDVLKNFNIDSQACMHVPRLEEKEATAILLERMHVKISALGVEQSGYASKCANRCSFKEDINALPTFHPLALKAFGRHLFNKHGCALSKWVVEIDGFANGARNGSDGIFVMVEKAFDDMDPKHRNIFMLLTRHMPVNVPSDIVFKWAALNCNEEISYIMEAVEDLRSNAFLEEIRPQIFIHDYIKEFAETKNKNYYKVGESKFRDEIVRGISRLIPQKYHVPAMEGEARMCQEVLDFFNSVHPNEKGIRIAGLCGAPSLGKTTLTKAFCNLNIANFNGEVYHVEFVSGGHSMDGQNMKLLTKGQRVLLVLDNIQTEESIDYVKYFIQADLGENSWILLTARSVNVLKTFIDVRTCMRLPGLEAKEAIAILLDSTPLAESALDAKNRGFALQCANRCSFKETSFHTFRGAHKFHPLALKTYGRHLSSKYGSDLSKWVLELQGLDGMLVALDKAFHNMDSKYYTIFMLLTVYTPPNLPPHKVMQWLAVNCKEEINFIEKAVEDLCKKAFFEEIKPEIRIHDLYMEFAQCKARKMGGWLFSETKGDLLSEDEVRFELAKLEHCQHQDLSQIGDRYLKNLCALQVERNETRNLRLSSMKNIRSLTLHNSEYLEELQGMENLQSLAWIQIVNVPNLKVLYLSSLNALQYLEINTGGGPTELGDLTGCISLTEIYVRCPSLSKLPRLNGLPNLEKVNFKACEKVNGPLDCRSCIKLQSIVFEDCWQMAHIPLIDGCSSLSNIVLDRCDQVTECSGKDESSAIEILTLCISSEDASAPRLSECFDGSKNMPLLNVVVSRGVPSLRRFSNLTVLELYNCDICEPPDVACCRMLQEICFSTLKNLESFPDFSSLRKLKRLSLCNCKRVCAPPDIGGCYSLQVFHLLYNDSMKGLPKMDGCQVLERIKVSWQSEEVYYYSHTYEYDDLEFFPDHQKDGIFPNIDDVSMPAELKEWQWMQGKRVRVQQYFCGEKVYYSITAPCRSFCGSEPQKQASNAGSGSVSFKQVIIQRTSAVFAYQRELKGVSMTDDDNLRFRENIMRAIDRLIPPRIRFPYSSMQKATTHIWLEKASVIKGISVAGLYEVQGGEKTTLRKSFYNFQLKGFEDEVSTIEFPKGNSIQRLNSGLRYLTCSPSLEMTLQPGEFLDEERPEFFLMIVLIRYPVPNKFMNDNLMHIARDFNRYWRGRTRIIVHSKSYTIIELSRP